MSSSPSSESNLRSLFETALREYEKQAGTNLLDTGNSLIIKLQNCDSTDNINAVLQEQAQAFRRFRGDNGKLNKWLKRTVHVLHTLSTSSVLGGAIGLVSFALNCHSQGCFLRVIVQPFPPANAIFAGIGILLAVCIILGLISRGLMLSVVIRRLK